MTADLDRLALEIKELSPVELKDLRVKLADFGLWLQIPSLPREQAAANLKRMINKMEER